MAHSIYDKWKSITDAIYAHDTPAARGAMMLRALIKWSGIKERPGHKKLAWNIFVYDKERYAMLENKPLGFGITYLKPDGVKTQDIFIVNPVDDPDKIESYYSEGRGMVKKYPSLKGVHKKNLPV